ncbi:hypothetical protein HanIR_Chr05g0209101 [Helianthus annuus]|nr:hypothetical protein HanIR_Chr05g0209101 [Helianthus annuus]
MISNGRVITLESIPRIPDYVIESRCDQVQGVGLRRLRSHGLMCIIVKFLFGSYI